MSYAFERGELTLGTRIFKGFSGFDDDGQPTNEVIIQGAQSLPYDRTVGNQEAGGVTLDWSDIGQMFEFIDELAQLGPYREVEFSISYTFVAPGRPLLLLELDRVRLLADPISGSSGEAFTSSMNCSYLYRRLNGHLAHTP